MVPAPAAAGGAAGGAGGDGSGATPGAPPGIRFRTPSAVFINGRKPARWVWYTVPVKLATDATWLPGPYSRSNSVPQSSRKTTSADPDPGRSWIPVS